MARLTGETAAQEKARHLGYRVRWAVEAILRDQAEAHGGRLVSRERIPGDSAFGTATEPDVATGLVLARKVELAAADEVRKYIKLAREEGLTWRRIGELLNLKARASADHVTLAEAAFTVAAGPASDSWFSLRHPRVFRWNCPECGRAIDDAGPQLHPSEYGPDEAHRPRCKRRAADQRAWHLNDKERGQL